jgi:hypothetical protein
VSDVKLFIAVMVKFQFVWVSFPTIHTGMSREVGNDILPSFISAGSSSIANILYMLLSVFVVPLVCTFSTTFAANGVPLTEKDVSEWKLFNRFFGITFGTNLCDGRRWRIAVQVR